MFHKIIEFQPYNVIFKHCKQIFSNARLHAMPKRYLKSICDEAQKEEGEDVHKNDDDLR